MNEETMPSISEKELSEILQVRRDKLAALQEAGKDPFAITKYDVTHHSRDVLESFDALESKDVSVAGRLMVKRVMGKALSDELAYRLSCLDIASDRNRTLDFLVKCRSACEGCLGLIVDYLRVDVGIASEDAKPGAFTSAGNLLSDTDMLSLTDFILVNSANHVLYPLCLTS